MVKVFDSRDYLNSHTPRTVPSSLVSPADAYFEPGYFTDLLQGDGADEPEDRPLSWEEEFSD